MAVAGRNGIQVISVATHQVIRCLPSALVMGQGVGPIAFSPDGKSLADGGATQTGHTVVEVWNIATGQQTASLPTKAIGIAGIGFSTDGKTLIDLGGANATAGPFELWDLATSTLVGSPLTDIHNPASMAVSPDGHTVALGGYDGMGDGAVELWDITTQTQTNGFVTSVNLATSALAFSADGTNLAYGSEVANFGLGTSQGILGVFNVTTGTILKTFPTAASTFVTSVAISPDGTTLADSFNTNSIELWSIASGNAIATLNNNLPVTNLVQFSPDGKKLLDGGYANVSNANNSGLLGVIDEWSTSNWSLIQSTVTDPLEGIGAFALSPDGVTIAAGGLSTNMTADRLALVNVWNTATGQLTATLNSSATYGFNAMAFSPLGSLLADGGEDSSAGVIELWGVPSGSLYGTLPTSASSGVTAMAFSPDGSTLATGGTSPAGGIVELWNVASKTLIRPFGSSENYHIYSVAFSPDGTRLAIGGVSKVNSALDGFVEVWNVSTGALVSTLSASNLMAVYSAAFSPDGTTVVAGGIAGTSISDEVGVAQQWNVSSGLLVASLPLSAKTLNATSVSFTKDGQYLFVGTNNGIQVIDVAAQTLAADYNGGFLGSSGQNFAYVSPDGTKVGYSNPFLASIAISPNPFYLPALSSVTLNPTSVQGGTSSTGTLTLASPAPSAGATVPLSSSSASAIVPASVSVPSGATKATFTVTTTGVNAQFTSTITAGHGATAKTATLTILPPTLMGLTLNPTIVVGGTSATGTLTISGPAGPGGLPVSLSSSLSSGMVPNSITVPAGKTSTIFTLTTFPVSSQSTATIMATLGSANLTATLTVRAPTVSALSLSPSEVAGGNSSTGTVTLSGAAGPNGVIVQLSSSSPSALVPSTVTVASGKASATFTVNTKFVTKQVLATVKATAGSVSKTATLQIDATTPTSITLSPSSVIGGTVSIGTVTLTAPAPKGGLVVKVKSNSPSASVTGTVTVGYGKTQGTFNIRTSAVAAQKSATITATLNGGSASATLTILAPSLTSLNLAPSSVVGGANSLGSVKISGPAPMGGLKITLSSSTSAAAVLGTVIIGSGASRATFTVRTLPVATLTVASITGKLGVNSKSATLTINPPAVKSVTLSPSTVKGGKSANGTVTITSAAPVGGLVVLLSSSSNLATVPGSITIPAGRTIGSFRAQASTPSSTTTVTLSASTSGGVAKSAVLTIL